MSNQGGDAEQPKSSQGQDGTKRLKISQDDKVQTS